MLSAAKRPVPELTRQRQRQASDPNTSVWVAANAGSGKTHVLAQRVVRLLLEGVAPGRILCLTYTKAAAANMAARVFDMLAGWTTMEDAELRAQIENIGEDGIDRDKLRFARRLFARTVETPGGLKVQTIHAFCERLLHLFPFEANVAAGFRVVEDVEQAELLSIARQHALADAARDCDGLGKAVRRVASETYARGFQDLLRELLNRRAALVPWLPVDQSGVEDALRQVLSLSRDETESEIIREMVEGGIHPLEWRAIGEALKACGSANDKKKALELDNAARAYEGGDLSLSLSSYLCAFFSKDGEGNVFDNFVTKSVSKEHPHLVQIFASEATRLSALREKRKAAATCERSLALLQIADAVLQRYVRMKSDRGLLDFEDLIARTVQLLKRSDQRWILFKLDAGLDHVLVDEAQDTSEAQWDILAQLTEDFFSGAGQRITRRTFFAVGDDKQSIFSFQGAAPKKFFEMHREFKTRVIAGGENFAEVPLNLSFRSSPDVLFAVDEVFAAEAHHRGLLADPNEKPPPHEAWKSNLPGIVELWDLESKAEGEEPRDWRLPLDRLDDADPPVKLARRIAARIKTILDPRSVEGVEGEHPESSRPVRPGDFLILVRKRDAFFEAMIRALKERDVPTAGADRLKLGEHIAVMDLIAAAQAALLPEDDLTLATVLKSPLIGLDDNDLLALAPGRKGSLYDALLASTELWHAEAVRRINTWRERAATWTPFDFFSQILGPERGRERFLARLGPEANDAIDEFLRLTLAHEREEAPALATFLSRFAALELEIKRDMDTAQDNVRVMTVHAAKGLEAKIIFLPDTCSLPAPQSAPCLFPIGNQRQPLIVWSPKKAGDPAPVADARLQQKEMQEAEYRRLLYVAMTRAEERLIIAGYQGARTPPEDCWYRMVRRSLEPGAEVMADPVSPEMTILRRGRPRANVGAATAVREGAANNDIPAWLRAAILPEPGGTGRIRPSHARDPSLRETHSEAALEKGRLLHALLQHLPEVHPQARAAAGERFLGAQALNMDSEGRSGLVNQACAVLDHPACAALFASGSLAEVEIGATVPLPADETIEVSGRVDRLLVNPDEVRFCDFKTGASPPSLEATPRTHVTQAALYRAALAALYPDRPIRAFLIWTEAPQIVELPPAMLNEALAALAAAP
ncbi:MAG: ATP-dependent helicase/nuclease subunit [Methylobacteriaceae bacterium]|nr:ATP-dependent helicase/nuclease subunit [Methylobacteriaceae bacterium]